MKMSLSRCVWAATAAAVLVFAPLRQGPGQASGQAGHPSHRVHSEYRELCRLLAVWDPNRTETSVVPAPQPPIAGRWHGLVSGEAAAAVTVNVTYSDNFDPAAKVAFQAAVDIWATQISSPVPITVTAIWKDLGSGVLGQAGSTFLEPGSYPTWGGATNTYYHSALANKLAGMDLDPANSDITATLNSAFTSWYFGTDSAAPFNRYDFMSVVLHELGHGLAFSGSGTSNGSTGSYGFSGIPMIYDRFVETASRQAILNTALFPNPSVALHAAFTSEIASDATTGLFWYGAAGVTAAGGGTNRPRLDALAPFSSGSNYSHLSEATYPPGNPNSLMTRALTNGEVIHNPGPLTLGIFQDQGWSLTETAPSITTQPSSATVSAGTNHSFTVAAPGATTYRWQISTNGGTAWSNLSDVTPYSGTATATLTITTTPATLTGYQYRCVVSNSAGSVTSNAATLTISGGTSVSPTALRFAATKAGATGALTSQTPAQTVSVSFPGTASAWTASANQTWVQITNGSASRSGQFSVAIVNPSNVIGGSTSLSATITISAPSSSTPTVTLPVTLTVDQTGQVSAPFGYWDTPADGSTGLVGSIAVTGWALDNVGIDHVELWRTCTAVDSAASACAPAPDGATKVFIGRATIVSGARPDVAVAYPSLPASDQAGFGYLLLTNLLPDLSRGTAQGGNGTFVLSTYAVNVGGSVTSLGTKTITVDNAHATIPFGAIDTPAQGATIPGPAAPYNDPNSYPMFGWAMTGIPKCMNTTDLTAYKVFIDGVSAPVTSSNFAAGLTRSDLPAAFPGLCNSDNALAVYYFNATALGLASGIHTLLWQITDNGGNVTNIGSRYFNLLTSSQLTSSQHAPGEAPPVSTADRLVVPTVRLGDARALVTLAPATTRVGARVDADDGPFAWTSPDATGHVQVQAPLVSRLTLDLDGPVDRGYQRVGDALQALPIGSTLDAAAGRFSWHPPVGYLGTFALVFVRGSEQIDVDVTWIDPTVAAPAVAMYLDRPAANGTATSPLTVAGWALDPRAPVGTGIAAVHVWARRLDAPTSAPVFLGAATLGIDRPDVARQYGAQFHGAGFALQAPGLDPGLYDLLIFPWKDRDRRFEAAQVLRITIR